MISRGWTILSVTTLGAFMSALDSNIVALALPKIALSLSSGVSFLGWVVTGYILATVAFLLQAGRIGDRYGRKRIYLSGFAFFGAASAICGLSQSIIELIVSRVLQGAGAAMLQATTTPLVFESFPPRLRGTAIGIISTAWAIGAVTGPVLGGFLVAFDWRLIFFVNVPVAATGVLVGAKVIQTGRPQLASNIKDFNGLNSLLLGATVATILVSLTFFDFRYLVVGLVTFLALALAERRSKNPVLDPELRKSRGFVYAAIVLGISQIAYLGIPFALSFHFQSVLGFSSAAAGLFVVPLSIALVVSNPIGGRLFDRLKRPASLALLGVAIDGASTIALGISVAAGTSPYLVSSLLAVVGFGGGFVWTPMISSLLKFASPEHRGLANGTALTLVNIGYAASIAVVIAVSAALLPASAVSQIYLGSFGNLNAALVELFKQGIARALLTLGFVNFLVMPFILLVLKEQRRFL